MNRNLFIICFATAIFMSCFNSADTKTNMPNSNVPKNASKNNINEEILGKYIFYEGSANKINLKKNLFDNFNEIVWDSILFSKNQICCYLNSQIQKFNLSCISRIGSTDAYDIASDKIHLTIRYYKKEKLLCNNILYCNIKFKKIR